MDAQNIEYICGQKHVVMNEIYNISRYILLNSISGHQSFSLLVKVCGHALSSSHVHDANNFKQQTLLVVNLYIICIYVNKKYIFIDKNKNVLINMTFFRLGDYKNKRVWR